MKQWQVSPKGKNILGWIAVGLSLFIALLWTFWGMLENFHEGWYFPSLWQNLLIMLIQYIPFALAFILLPIIALHWKKIGLLIFIALGIFSIFFFSGASFQVVYLMLVLPLIGLGIMFYFGDPQPRKIAIQMLTLLPLILMVAIAIPNIIRIQQRDNDNNFNTRVVDCQEQPLLWAGRGAGFPQTGSTWATAQYSCNHLSADGTQIMAEEQNIWRLPNIEEAVRCQTRAGENAGGTWNKEKQTVQYLRTPDKETPIWDPYSQIIYYWTSELVPSVENRAYIIDYKGGIFNKDIRYRPNYHAFRCVRDVE